MIEQVKVVLDPSVRDLCRKPYPGHPRGCPNYGKRHTCPPQAPMLSDVLDLSRQVWAVWVEFDIKAQRFKMWFKHPKWSKRQAECCLYWQGVVRKRLRREMHVFISDPDMELFGDRLVPIEVPEAMGVNVTETMRGIGVELEWPPERIVRKIGLLGHYK